MSVLKGLGGLAHVLKSNEGGKTPRCLPASCADVVDLLRSEIIHDLCGYFQNHRPQSPYSTVDNEYKVQDLVYCLLRPIIPDLQYENPFAKPTGSLTYVQIDFFSKSLDMLIEIKYVDSKEKAKRVEKEMSEDITKYSRSYHFKVLLFFVYCSGYSYPNKLEFENGFTNEYTLGTKAFQTSCIVN